MVEFVFLAVLLMVPLFYLVMVLARLQAGAYAVSGAAREAGRAYTTATAPAQAPARADAAAGIAFRTRASRHGLRHLACDGTPACDPTAGSRSPPASPFRCRWCPVFAGVLPTSIPVSASHVATVDRFRQP